LLIMTISSMLKLMRCTSFAWWLIYAEGVYHFLGK
jgi:hypothetical protein